MGERTPLDYGNEPYKIHAFPDLQTASTATPVTYKCGMLRMAAVTKDEYVLPPPSFAKIDWQIFYDNATVKERGVPDVEKLGMNWPSLNNYKWKIPGNHLLACTVDFKDNRLDENMQGVHVFYFRQHVETVEALLGAKIVEYKDAQLPIPYPQLSFARRYSEVLKKAAQYADESAAARRKASIRRDELGRPLALPSALPDYSPDLSMTPKQRDEHLKKVAELDKFVERLQFLIDSGGTCTAECYPIYVVHLETSTSQTSALRAFIAPGPTTGAERTWKLVDWTNPINQLTSGVYIGKGATDEEAIRDAIRDWSDGENRTGNRYPPGIIEYEIPRMDIKGTFPTTGATYWDNIASFFDTVGTAAGIIALIAGVITAVAPVPGSQVVSGVIWGLMFTSAAAGIAAAGIRIGQRRDEGFSFGRDDVFDGLTIVANVLTLGEMGWTKGATLLFKGKALKGLKAPKWVFVGMIAADGAQGIMIAQDSFEEYEKIMQNPQLSPGERTQQLLHLFLGLGQQGLLLYLSTKGNMNEVAEARAGKTWMNPDDLRIAGKEIPVSENLPIEGHTSTKEPHHTTVYDEQVPNRGTPDEAAALAARPTRGAQARKRFKEAASAEKRGMRARDSEAFEALAKESDGGHVFVRDSNPDSVPYIGKPGYEGKPEKLKAKTAKSGKHKGLAVADPRDTGLQAMLKEKGIEYSQYVEELEKAGYKVHADNEYLITKKDPASGNKGFYSDYDLHGVYDKQGNLVNASEVQKKMNKDAGQNVVQHTGHDEWPLRDDREKAGVNYGPQPPVTVYGPDGTFKLDTWADMKAYAEIYGLRLEEQYRMINWDKWKEIRSQSGKSTDM
jgi:hypothetical protein